MQKNRLDHAIRSRFLFTYVIWCNNYPYLPIGASLSDPPSDSKYRYAIAFSGEHSYYEFTTRMQHEQIAYLPVIRRRRGFWVKLLEPRESDSLTTLLMWRICKFAVFSMLTIYIPIAKFFDVLRTFILRA